MRACLNALTGRTPIPPTTARRSKGGSSPLIPSSPSLILWSLAATACLILYRVSPRLSCLHTAHNNTSSPPLLPPWAVPLFATVSVYHITVTPLPPPFTYTHTQNALPTKGGRTCSPLFPLFSSSRPNHSWVHVWSLSIARHARRHATPPPPQLGLACRDTSPGRRRPLRHGLVP